MMIQTKVSLLTVPLFLSVACGDVTTANGEFGRINYSLYTDYFSEQADLTSAGIVTDINRLHLTHRQGVG